MVNYCTSYSKCFSIFQSSPWFLPCWYISNGDFLLFLCINGDFMHHYSLKINCFLNLGSFVSFTFSTKCSVFILYQNEGCLNIQMRSESLRVHGSNVGVGAILNWSNHSTKWKRFIFHFILMSYNLSLSRIQPFVSHYKELNIFLKITDH